MSFARGGRALAHSVANHFSAAKRDLVAVGGEVFLHFDDELRVGQPDAVARGGAVQVGVNSPRDLRAHSLPSNGLLPSAPFTRPLWPWTILEPANSTSGASFSSPGSKRIAVPAGISRRIP